VTVTWTSGEPNSTALISGFSVQNAVGAAFYCYANINDGQFTVPPAVLLALPATGTGTSSFSGLTVGSTSIVNKFTAPKLDAPYIMRTIENQRGVVYQ
jgi:hypothetical protein